MNYKRREYITNAPFQMKFVLTFIIVAFTGNILAVTIFNYIALKKLDDLIWSTHLRVRTINEIIGPLFIQVNAAAFVFICITLIIIGMIIARKISAPLYRMSKGLRTAADGDLTVNIALKQKDEFKSVANELDNAIHSLRNRFITLNEKHKEITRSIGELQEEIKTKKPGTDKIVPVLENIDLLTQEINKFKLSGKNKL